MRLFLLLVCLSFWVHANGQGQPANQLRPPISGLPTATPEESGFVRDSIDNLLKLIEDTPPEDFRGVVVIKDGQLVIEAYYNTFWRNSILDIRSAGKSVTALLMGIALKEGLVQDLEQDVHSFFSKRKYPTLRDDYRKITLRHLLDMSSGLDADSNDPQSPGHAFKWIAREEWKEYILNVPLIAEPGSWWVYADINPLLIATVIEEVSGMSLRDYAKEKLFDPLGIKQVYWFTNAANQTGGAGNLYLSTMDLAKLGLLVLNEGFWGEKSIIDSGYIKMLSEESLDISDTNPYADAYGLLWYKSRRLFGNNTFQYLFASGVGGNHLIVIPDHNLVISLTSSAYGQGYGHGRSYTIMGKILAALK